MKKIILSLLFVVLLSSYVGASDSVISKAVSYNSYLGWHVIVNFEEDVKLSATGPIDNGFNTAVIGSDNKFYEAYVRIVNNRTIVVSCTVFSKVDEGIFPVIVNLQEKKVKIRIQ